MGVAFKMPSFAAGEVSERMAARDDVERYHIGLSICENFRIMKEGGAEKRPAWRYLGKVKDGTKTTRSIGLERDATTSYTLEFGDLYVRIWKDRVNVLQLAGHASAEQLQLIDADYVWVQSGSGSDEWYLTSSYGGPAQIFGKPTETKRYRPSGVDNSLVEGVFGSLAVDEWGWGDNDSLGFATLYVRDSAADLNDYASNAYRLIVPGPLEFVTPYVEADIEGLKFDSSASVLFITHGSYPPARLSRTTDTSWLYNVIDFDADGNPVDFFDFETFQPMPIPPLTPDWLIEYAVTRIDSDGVEGKTRNLHITSDNQPDPASPPPIGNLGPVWSINETAQGDVRNLIVDASDYEWILYNTYTVPRLFGILAYFLAKKGSGLDGPAGGGTNLAQDPGLFDNMDVKGPVRCWDITNPLTPLPITRTARFTVVGVDGYNDNGRWSHKFARELDDFENAVGFTTLWHTEPIGKTFEFTVEEDFGYNLYRRIAAITGVDGLNSGSPYFPWGRLSALDAYGGTYLDLATEPFQDPATQEIFGAYKDNGDVTPDATREPPEPLDDFNAVNKYPSVISFLGQRMVLASTNLKGNKIWLSVTADFFDFVQADDSDDEDPIQRELTTADKILYMLSDGTGSLLVFTTGSEWRVWGVGGPVTPSTINSARSSGFGIADVVPLDVGGLVLYVTKLGKSVNSIGFDLASEKYKSNSISDMSDHIIGSNPGEGSPISGWVYAEHPNKTIYGYLEDGSMMGVTFNLDQQMNAWHRHSSRNGKFKSMSKVRSTIQDDVYAIVERVVNGKTEKYMEVLEDGDQSDQGQAFYLDSGLSLAMPSLTTDGTSSTFLTASRISIAAGHGLSIDDEIVLQRFEQVVYADPESPTPSELSKKAAIAALDGLRCKVSAETATTITLGDLVTGTALTFDESTFGFHVMDFAVRRLVKTIYGLDHLEGEIISVLSDGRDVGFHTVLNARIVLSDGAADVVAGYGISSKLDMLDFSGSAGQSTLEGKPRNISRVTAHVIRTLGLKTGLSEDRLTDFKFPRGENSRVAQPLFTGKIEVAMRGEWNKSGAAIFRHDTPHPCTILAVTPEFDIGG